MRQGKPSRRSRVHTPAFCLPAAHGLAWVQLKFGSGNEYSGSAYVQNLAVDAMRGRGRRMSARRGSPLPVQGSLMGVEAAPETGSLFLGVFPPSAVCEAIAVEIDALRVEHSLTGAPIKPNRLHATLHYLGEHAIERNDIVDKASLAASRVSHAGFDMVLASASSFSTRNDCHPCVLLCPEERPPIHGLWRQLGNQLMAAGLGRYLKRDFIPHVTVLYDSRVLTPQAIEPVRWQVRDFSLVRSQPGRSDYEILATWALRGS